MESRLPSSSRLFPNETISLRRKASTAGISVDVAAPSNRCQTRRAGDRPAFAEGRSRQLYALASGRPAHSRRPAIDAYTASPFRWPRRIGAAEVPSDSDAAPTFTTTLRTLPTTSSASVDTIFKANVRLMSGSIMMDWRKSPRCRVLMRAACSAGIQPVARPRGPSWHARRLGSARSVQRARPSPENRLAVHAPGAKPFTAVDRICASLKRRRSPSLRRSRQASRQWS